MNASPSPFQSNDFETFLINVICVLLMYGSAYLANTGAMLFGKWIPEKTGFPVACLTASEARSGTPVANQKSVPPRARAMSQGEAALELPLRHHFPTTVQAVAAAARASMASYGLAGCFYARLELEDTDPNGNAFYPPRRYHRL